MSQPTLHRAVKKLSSEIQAFGGPRNRIVAALRSVRGLAQTLPVYRISETGEAEIIGQLTPIHLKGFIWSPTAAPNRIQVFSGVPFYLDDLRPQGFLGRTFNQKFPELKLPSRLLDWTDDDHLEALTKRGEDLPGNLLIGQESFDRYQLLLRKKETSPNPTLADTYMEFAAQVSRGDSTGSSTGGEQPKFCTVIIQKKNSAPPEHKHVLVKFSPESRSFAASRWKDLLISESLALQVLKDSGIAASQARIIETKERVFLEVERFDRIGAHGRRPLISLAALENEWLGRTQSWAQSAEKLHSLGKISKGDLDRIYLLEAFGRLIGNSDRHPGNLSFEWEPTQTQARLAPTYDMLPMEFAPASNGDDRKSIYKAPIPDSQIYSAWPKALKIAQKFWDLVAQDSRVSEEFKEIANSAIRELAESKI